MNVIKHIDPTPPVDVIRRVYELLKQGLWTDLELWANLAYLIAWSLDFLKTKSDPIFGSTATEQEFCTECLNICDWASEGRLKFERGIIGSWLVKTMLLAMLDRLIKQLTEAGVPDWLLQILEQIKMDIGTL